MGRAARWDLSTFLYNTSSGTAETKLEFACFELIDGHRKSKSGQDKSRNCADGSISHNTCKLPGYVFLVFVTGLPPFIIADALVLLLGVTPAFGTVSPTSCNDGSRYMATSNGLGRK